MKGARIGRLLGAAQRTFMDRLTLVTGGEAEAERLLRSALGSARRVALPLDADQLLDFARAHLAPLLGEDLGAQTALVFLEDLSLALAPAEEPPSRSRLRASPIPAAREIAATQRRWGRGAAGEHLRLMLAHADPLQRARLARQLVASGCEVILVESFLEAIAIPEAPGLALVDLGHASVDLLLTGMVTRSPGLRVLGLLSVGCDADATFRQAGIEVFETALPSVWGATLVDRLRALTRR